MPPYSPQAHDGRPANPYYNQAAQARSAYPTFLSLPETLKLQISWAWRGLVDANRWDFVISTAYGDPEIRANFLKSFMLNALSLTSIYVFDQLLHPLVRDQQKWLHRNVGWFYRVLWLFPVVGASLYMNSSWCNVVANRSYMLRHGSRKAAPPSTYTGILTSLATSAYRAVMICTSVLISIALTYIPVAGNAASFLFFCWVDSFYCFEFIWIARGLTLAQRIRHLEERWAYYLAFGLPSSAICMWGSTLANAALFALVLPSYVIMAMHAEPVPSNPYNPLAFKSDYSTHEGQQTIRYPSPFVPIRMPIFALVVWLNDRIVSLLSVGRGKGHQNVYGADVVGSSRRRRGLSDSTVESVEEGNADTINLSAVYNTARSTASIRLNNIGSRRKAD